MAYSGKKDDHNKKQSEMSLELGNLFDMDELVGDIINEDDAAGVDTAFIPSKDSSDEDKPPTADAILASIPSTDSTDNRKPMKSPINSNINTRLDATQNTSLQMTPNTLNKRAEDAMDGLLDTPIDADTPRLSENGVSGISMDMEQFTLHDIDAFGDEEHKGNASPVDYEADDIDYGDLDLGDKNEVQHILDETVMTLLHPDYYNESDSNTRREQLRKHTPKIRNWKASEIDIKIIEVAENMSKIELVSMYDSLCLPSVEEKDEKEKEPYLLKEVDLVEIKAIPAKYFGGDVGGGGLLKNNDNNPGLLKGRSAGAGADYLRANTEVVGQGFSNAMAGMGQLGGALLGSGDGKASIVCSACGVRLKFKAKKRHKYNYVAYKCKKTNREYVYHDYLCVKLRKIKEAIKTFVFQREKEENNNMEDENALINIDKQVTTQKDNYRSRPVQRTTPKKGDHNYLQVEDEREESRSSTTRGVNYSADGDEYEYSDNDGMTDDEESTTGRTDAKSKKETKKEKKKKKNALGFIAADGIEIPEHLHFRRYRVQVYQTLQRFNGKKKFSGPSYSDRFADLPDILLFCDLNEFGVAIWEFVSEALKSKMRRALWHILEWLALEMPTNEVLHLLKRHTHLLSKHELPNYDRVCKATMEGSKFPIACTLRLSAFMYERAEIDLSNREDFKQKGEQYVNVARKLLKEIESDHLFALLLMIPTDIGHQNVIEIALKHELVHFLEEPRIVRVFAVLMFNGYDFLDPDNDFSEPEISIDILYDKLRKQPGRFYFSPYGKFWVSALLYLGYLLLFSYITWQQIYDYTVDFTLMEYLLWGCSAGYVTYEVLEFIDSPKDYFSSMANYWDIFIAIDWLILAYFRFIHDDERIYDESGSLDEAATRNTTATELYMIFWALQCVLLWTRVASLFKVSQRAGPLIRMIMNMLGDIANFFLIWILFFIGGSFAAYYVIGGDLQDIDGRNLGTMSSVSFYTFKTLIGQQDWDKVESADDDNGVEVFDTMRSNMVITLLLFYSIFGTILLLNLLIAMMASSYEAVKDQSLQELNKQKIETYYDLDKSRGIITPPFNMLAYTFYVYWFAFEIVTWALTFGHRQFNEEYFSPLNKGNGQYTAGDIIKFRKGQKELKGECLSKTPKSERSTKAFTQLGRPSVAAAVANQDEFESDLVVEHHGVKYNLTDKDILKVKKTFFKRRKTRIPSLEIENHYCRYCRYNFTSDSMSIKYYLSLFEQKGQHIDPDDKKYMRDLLSPANEYGIPNPVTCDLCPNCYRPYKLLATGPDVLNRMMFVLEIVSYMVFILTFRWVIILIIFIPAVIVKLIKYIIKKSTQIITGKRGGRSSKSIMNTSEENDDYRAKVRQVSKQEEKMDAIVRRIDGNVKRLETTLIGAVNEEDEDIEDEIHNLRSDEFDQEVREMKKEINKRFDQIQKLLSNSGFQD